MTEDANAARETDLEIDGVDLKVLEVGVSGGPAIIHFHGTPGSRLELAFSLEAVSAAGARMITFDRPGYGAATQVPFSLASVGRIALQVADRLGIDRFRATGFSGGGPFALATAAIGGARVEAVGVISGAGPFQLVAGALDNLSEGDKAAERLIGVDRQAAAAAFVDALTVDELDLVGALAGEETLYKTFEPVLSDSDRLIFTDPSNSKAILAEMREALRPGLWGYAWDNVAWIGPWDIDPTTVPCPVLLWYGTEDLMAPEANAHWLEQNIANAKLTMYEGEGHLLPFAHLTDMLRMLLAA